MSHSLHKHINFILCQSVFAYCLHSSKPSHSSLLWESTENFSSDVNPWHVYFCFCMQFCKLLLYVFSLTKHWMQTALVLNFSYSQCSNLTTLSSVQVECSFSLVQKSILQMRINLIELMPNLSTLSQQKRWKHVNFQVPYTVKVFKISWMKVISVKTC